MFQTPQRAARAAGVTALAALAVAAGASPVAAYTGGVSPLTQSILSPGTQTSVDGWKLAGTVNGSSSNVLVAPRWVIASGHAAPGVGSTITFPGGQSSKVLNRYVLHQTRRHQELGAFADLSVALLEGEMAAPAGGFPRLLAEPITDDLKTALPGWVLWAGYGPQAVPAKLLAGWTKPDGGAAPGATTLQGVPGDSGSTGLLYSTPTSRPLMPGVTDYGQTVSYGGAVRSSQGMDARFTDVLAATATEPAITIRGWLTQQFAKHPTASPPTFATFAEAGMPFSGMRPVAPAGLAVKSSTATSVTLGWKAQVDQRVPLAGYRISVAGRDPSQLPSSATTHTVDGLAPTANHTFTLTAVNAAGPSTAAVGRPNTISYRTRTVSAVSDLKIVGVRDRDYVGPQTFTKYCIAISWLPATTDPGDAITGHEVRVNGDIVNTGVNPASDPTVGLVTGGRHQLRHCGLAPDTAYTVNVAARSGVSIGPAVSGSGRTLPGVPAGTPLTGPRNVQSSVKRTITNGTADYCMTTNWEAPVPVDGWPVATYRVAFSESATGSTTVLRTYNQGGLAPTTRSHRVCGVNSGRAVRVVVSVDYQDVAATLFGAAFILTSPSGAPVDTVIQPPQAVTFAPRKTVTLQGKTDYCVVVNWQAPATVDGFPVKSYSVVAFRSLFPSALATGLPASRRSETLCGLDPGRTYGAYITPMYDADGDPPAASGSFVTPSGAPRGTTVTGPVSPTIATRVRNTGGEVDYCANITWQPPVALDGFPAKGYVAMVYDEGTGWPVAGTDLLALDRRSAQVCDLQPGRAYHSRVAATFGDNAMPIATARSIASTTFAGAPAGTPWPLPQALQIVTSTENGERCATVSWQPPVALAGLPVLGYMAFFSQPGFVEYDPDMDADVRSYKACGLPQGRVSARVSALYTDGAMSSAIRAFDATTGALLS